MARAAGRAAALTEPQRAVREELRASAEQIGLRLAAGRSGARVSRVEWATRNITLAGGPFSFAGHEYQRGVYECEAPHIVIRKAAQMGGSLFGILDALWALDTGQARTAIYFFPTARDIRDFAHDRVKPIISGSARLSARSRGIDNAGYTQFTDAFGAVSGALYFRGMKSKVSTSSVPADLIMIDERDKVSTADYELALKRVSHSELALVREACTPTVSGIGIDALFERSDKRHWTLRCARCGKENRPELEFRENGGPERTLYERGGEVYLGCAACAAPLDAASGRWVAEMPGRDIAGFQFSQLWSQVVQRGAPMARAILDDFRNTRHIADFWNSRIGLPYEDKTTSLTRDALDACDGDYGLAPRGSACTMGVDQGDELHVVISERQQGIRRVVWAGVLDGFGGLPGLMRNYDVRSCVIDAMPNTHSARDFAAMFPGRVFLCHYVESARGGPRWNSSERAVAVNRTEALDAAAAAYRRLEVRLPKAPVIEDLFKPQMGAMVRRPIRDENGDIEGYEWAKRGADHFRHADCYDQLAGARRGRSLGDILSGVLDSGPRESVASSPTDSPRVPPATKSARAPSDEPFIKKEMENW
ncbi:MAG: Phage terminase large subunit (GpA) [bacterium ADurb.Bin236]|nr:MAG: Phage terminase large subunit (GpA) [bacterium ADurb.Bin236]HOY62038.1 phage terminase large subunit family protein [bacterium]HPN95616.1 phage terminase large subunit family protein [bacterium]